MARRRRARGRRRRGRRGVGLRKAFNGGLVRGRMHPSVNSASPWNSYTLTTTWVAGDTAGIHCYTSSPLLVQVRRELGIAVDAAIDFRLLRVDLWVPPTLANSDRNFIVLSPSDWSARIACTESSQLNWFEGWGTAVQPAHVHYIWPKSISNIVIANGKDYTLFKCDIKANCQYIVKFHLLWRPSIPDPRPTGQLGYYQPMREYLLASPDTDTDFVYVANQPGVVSPLTEQVANTII